MKRLALAAALIVLSSAALAGEDSTHRAYGFGPPWHSSKCGLREFNWLATTREEAERCVTDHRK
jgi:hypothetical protein